MSQKYRHLGDIYKKHMSNLFLFLVAALGCGGSRFPWVRGAVSPVGLGSRGSGVQAGGLEVGNQ